MYLYTGQYDKDTGEAEYVPWVDLAGFRVYIHNQSEGVYSESVSYVVGPGFYTTLGLQYVRFVCATKIALL